MNCAQAVCDALDELDRTPFGDMGKALDKISDLAIKSAQQAVKLEAQIGGAEMSEAKHSELPWQWHPESKDQAHTGAVFRMERPGHAYAIAMKPRYVSDEQWADDAAFIVKACNAHDKIVAALDGMVMVCGRTGSSLEDFEEQAEAFYQETRFMRPGKSMPMGGGGEHDDDIRRDKFNAWVKSKIAAGRAALASLKED